MKAPGDTIAAVATPRGEAGLGVLRLSGPQARMIARGSFRAASSFDWNSDLSPQSVVGWIWDDAVQVDQAVATLFRAPQSYTGEDVVEFSIHGSPVGLDRVLQLLLHRGARLADPGEFSLRAFLNGKLDLSQAEAVAELIHARSRKTHAAAAAQLQGSLAEAVRALREPLMGLLAHVEVGLDHSDENHDFLSRDALDNALVPVHQGLQALRASARTGRVLREGWRVALVGRPNVGKSSLLNALLKTDRAIVTPIAGTTRDTLEERLDADGLPLILTDTAGLRADSSDPVERLGMERTRQAIATADQVIALFDGTEPLSPEDRQIVQACLDKPHVWAINKIDQPVALGSADLASLNGAAPVIRISAQSGEGLSALIDEIRRTAFSGAAQHAQAHWLLNARHEAALQRAQDALHRAQTAVADDQFEEVAALELKTALDALGDIIGETTTEDLLDQIFSRFCVGK